MIHIILPVHDRARVTAEFLRCLQHQTVLERRLLLVDDGCTDDTVAITRRMVAPADLVVLRGDGNLWWAGALELAYQALRADPAVGPGDAVLIVNDDITFEPDFLAQGLAALADAPGAAIQAVGIDRATGTLDTGAVANVARLDFRAAAPGEAPNCLSTRGLIMQAGTFLASGGFRPRWLPHYLSDYEFTLRLARHGVPLKVDPRFRATVALELTGMSGPRGGGMRQVWRDSFSNRAKWNPLHWSAFVVLACPLRTAPWHLARIWLRFARSLFSPGPATPRGAAR